MCQGLVITALQCVMALTSWYNESSEGGTTPYSKFAPKGSGIPTRNGMLLIYLPYVDKQSLYIYVYSNII